jgi:hypothetical protein
MSHFFKKTKRDFYAMSSHIITFLSSHSVAYHTLKYGYHLIDLAMLDSVKENNMNILESKKAKINRVESS